MNDLGELAGPLLRLAGSIDSIIYLARREPGRALVWLSPAVERFFCFPPDEWLADADALQRHVHADDGARVRCELRDWLASGAREPLHLKYRLIAKDGRVCWCRESLFAASEETVVGAIIDVTELMVLKSTLEAVAGAAQPREAVLAFCDALAQALALDETGWVSEVRRERLECRYAELGRRIEARWLDEEAAPAPVSELVRSVIDEGRSTFRDGWLAAPVPGPSGTQGALFGRPRSSGLHIPRMQRVAEALAQQLAVALERADLVARLELTSRDQKRLAEALVRAHEAERGRLAKELHDGAGQTLTAAKIQLDLAERAMPEAGRAPLSLARRQVEETLEDLRRLSHALRPAALDRLGLGHALREMCGALSSASFQVALSMAEPVPALPAEHSIALFRIAQAALTNVVRHAQAARAEVRLALDQAARTVSLEVRDDGRGFDPAQAARSLGLFAMHERAAALGGSLSLESAPGAGCCVRAVLPL
jgi:signal transduction histidine kinase